MIKTYFDSVNKIWSGTKMPLIYNSNVSLGYLILHIFQNNPDAITQISVDTGIQLSCRQMYLKTINIASYLQELGIGHGDIAGFLTSNSDNLTPTVFACLTLGLPINSLAPLMSESDMIFCYSNTKPKLIFCDADHVSKLERVVEKLSTFFKILTVDRKVDGLEFIGDVLDRDYGTQTFIVPTFDSDSIAFIMSTSGTSDNLKLVCKSHKEMIKLLVPQSFSKSNYAFQDIWFAGSNIYYITGVVTLLMGTLYGGKRIFTSRPYEPNFFLDAISKYNVTTMIITPNLLAPFFKSERNKQITSMKYMILGGNPLSTRMYEKAKLLFPNCEICHSYGTTEASRLAMNLSNIKHTSVGQLYMNIEMKILNDDGNELGVDETGEIVYRSSEMFQGYFNDPLKTAETIKDGWIYSGDLGYFDKDGFLFLVDRKKYIFKTEQVYVSAAELESVIMDINAVMEVSVAGVYDDVIGYDLIFAYVVKEPDSELTEKYVEDYVSKRVIDGKKITGGVHFVASLPKTFSGKISRVDVNKLATEEYKNNNALFVNIKKEK